MANYLNIKQLSVKLGNRSETSIRRDIAAGHLPKSIRLSGTVLWDESEVDQHLKQSNAKAKSMAKPSQVQVTYQEAEQHFRTVSQKYSAANAHATELRAEMSKANNQNDAEINARVEAVGDGVEREDIALVNIPELEAEATAATEIVNRLIMQ